MAHTVTCMHNLTQTHTQSHRLIHTFLVLLHSTSSHCVQVSIAYLSSIVVIAIRVFSTKTTEGIPAILGDSYIVGGLAAAIPEQQMTPVYEVQKTTVQVTVTCRHGNCLTKTKQLKQLKSVKEVR